MPSIRYHNSLVRLPDRPKYFRVGDRVRFTSRNIPLQLPYGSEGTVIQMQRPDDVTFDARTFVRWDCMPSDDNEFWTVDEYLELVHTVDSVERAALQSVIDSLKEE